MVEGPIPTADFGARLLAALRQRTGVPNLDYRSPPGAVPGGNETSIYAFALDVSAAHELAGPLIARVFFEKRHTLQHAAEAVIHAHLFALGFPVPKVHLTGAGGAVGAPWIVMTRLPGIMLGSDALALPGGLLRLPSALRNVPAVLAATQARLHAVDPAPLRAALTDNAGSDRPFTVAGQVAAARAWIAPDEQPLAAALDTLTARLDERGPPVVCHGDFHPLNVLVDGRRVSGVIDWGKLCFAEREFDVATTLALLELTRLNLPRWARGSAERVLHRMGARYLAAYARRTGPLDARRIDYFYALRALLEIVYQRAHAVPELGDIGGWDLPRLAQVVDAYAGSDVGAVLRR